MAPGSAAFDFDGVVQRRGTASFKWDTYPQDVLPAFVADMDFVSPPAVVAALHERVEHGVFGYAVVPESMRRVVCTYLDRKSVV